MGNSRNIVTMLLLPRLMVIMSFQVALVQLQDSSPVCPQRIQSHFSDPVKVEDFFDALRKLESNGNVCEIGQNGIGPYQISKQHYDAAVNYDQQLKSGGKRRGPARSRGSLYSNKLWR